jgi:hypothetical protein
VKKTNTADRWKVPLRIGMFLEVPVSLNVARDAHRETIDQLRALTLPGATTNVRPLPCDVRPLYVPD